MISYNKRVCRILEDASAVDVAKLRDALTAADQKSRPISSVLVEQHLIEEKALLGILGEASKVPPIDLRNVQPDSLALESVPQDMAFYYGVYPVSRIGNVLTVALTNPFDVVKLDDLRIVTGCELRPVLTMEEALKLALDKGYKAGQQAVEQILESMQKAEDQIELKENPDDEEAGEAGSTVFDLEKIANDEDSPIVKFLNMAIYQAAKDRASDIHIEPYERKVSIRFRTDGVLKEAFAPPRKMLNALVSRVKIMAALDIAERRKPQDGKFQMRIEGRQIDFRVSILPVIHGEKVVMRLLDAGNLQLDLATLGFEQKALDDFRHAIAQPYGMILVTGPTGSGKSTTLYSSVREMLTPDDNFVTVEDPVEYQLEGVNQVQVNPKRGLTFASALRSILRQDPDTILIGEIRDAETIEIAIKAALTGHLVLSTLHTNDAPSTITRMVDMGVDPFMVASSTLLVSAQRLCRKLCTTCREQIEAPPKERLIALGLYESDFEDKDLPMTFFRAKGCPRCNAGYSGRFAILETLPMTEDVKRIIIKGGSAQEIKKSALANGMMSLRRCGIRAAARGRTSLEAVIATTLQDQEGVG
ncbi:MAG: Flp pilus assembly complex ATPase component TadA [Planctomycetes bacterium]|nr:Flp pilus assembly complex ATPase component TadA [Planctomycetota bacterium]